METPDEPIILCSEERKEERINLRRKLAKTDGKSVGKQEIRQKSPWDHLTKATARLTLDQGEKESEPLNPYWQKTKPKVRRLPDTHRWRLVADLGRRNRVGVAPDMKGPGDKELLKTVTGRPIKEHLGQHEYLNCLRRTLRNNVLAGFLQDKICAREENQASVTMAIEKAQREIDTVAKSMADFLNDEQRVCDDLTQKLNKVVEERKKWESKIGAEKKKMSEVKLEIFKQNEQLATMRKCREFVLQIAPEEWKLEYAKETDKRQEAVKDVSEKMKAALESFKTSCGGEDISLEMVLEDFVEEFSTAGPPSLPFADPKKVFELFKDIEMKSVRALHNNAHLKTLLEKSKCIEDSYENYLKNEQGAIDDLLKELKECIEKEENRVKEKKKLLQNMTEGPFKKMVASEDVLKEFAMIKDVYEELIDDPKKDLSTLEMLQEIGELFLELNCKLEHLPLAERKRLEKRAKKDLDKRMKEAEKAKRRKTQVQSMIKGLKRAREKPWKRSGRPLMFQSPRELRTPPTQINLEEEAPDVQPQMESGEELEAWLPLVWAVNHPGPGSLKKPESVPPPQDLTAFYPSLQVDDTEESDKLLTESEEDQEKKQPEEEKKIKKKKKLKVVFSDESDNLD